jgi:hypothetical protein
MSEWYVRILTASPYLLVEIYHLMWRLKVGQSALQKFQEELGQAITDPRLN